MGKQTTTQPKTRHRRSLLIPAGALLILLVAVALLRQNHAPQPATTGSDTVRSQPPRAAVYLPAEFAPQDLLLLGGSQLVNLFPQVLADIATATADQIGLRVLSGNAADHARIDSVLAVTNPAAGIIDLPVRSMWVRDFGPLTVSNREGRRRLVDFHYRERRGNKVDDKVPGHIGESLGLPVDSSTLLVEGGDLITNGRGFGLISARLINRNAYYDKLEPQEIVNRLAARLGFEQVSLATPLVGESTGHVDMFAAFLAVDLVLVGQYQAADDPDNAAGLDALAADLSQRTTLSGPLRVERIPMPDHRDGVWRTYTNIVLANGVVLVPVYPDYCPDLDAEALATYRRLLPERRIVGIDASGLIHMNGALRCITMNVPQGQVLNRHH